MRVTARMLGILSSVLILIVSISYILHYLQEYNKALDFKKQGYGDYTNLIFFTIMVGVAFCVYGLWLLLGAWLVTEHPVVAFFIFLIPGSLGAVIFLPFYRPNSSNLGEMGLAAGSLLNLSSCITAFIGIWEKDHHSILLTSWNN